MNKLLRFFSIFIFASTGSGSVLAMATRSNNFRDSLSLENLRSFERISERPAKPFSLQIEPGVMGEETYYGNDGKKVRFSEIVEEVFREDVEFNAAEKDTLENANFSTGKDGKLVSWASGLKVELINEVRRLRIGFSGGFYASTIKDRVIDFVERLKQTRPNEAIANEYERVLKRFMNRGLACNSVWRSNIDLFIDYNSDYELDGLQDLGFVKNASVYTKFGVGILTGNGSGDEDFVSSSLSRIGRKIEPYIFNDNLPISIRTAGFLNFENGSRVGLEVFGKTSFSTTHLIEKPVEPQQADPLELGGLSGSGQASGQDGPMRAPELGIYDYPRNKALVKRTPGFCISVMPFVGHELFDGALDLSAGYEISYRGGDKFESKDKFDNYFTKDYQFSTSYQNVKLRMFFDPKKFSEAEGSAYLMPQISLNATIPTFAKNAFTRSSLSLGLRFSY